MEKSVTQKFAENQARQGGLPLTRHRIVHGDARDLGFISDGSVHLIVTSPPYWTLKQYPGEERQLGLIKDYQDFLAELDKVWAECYRVLCPGGRMCVVVGDVCLSRRKHGRHQVIPLHADIQVRCRSLGFDSLAPIFWLKIANVKTEVDGNGSIYLGKPYEPGGVIKNDVEFVLLFRKGGEYRHPTPEQRIASLIGREEFRRWFQQVWSDVSGASTRHHPAPFPVEIARRLVRMFSFVGDTVLDPFAGTGTTAIACMESGRHSISVEIEVSYVDLMRQRLMRSSPRLASPVELEIVGAKATSEKGNGVYAIQREALAYQPSFTTDGEPWARGSRLREASHGLRRARPPWVECALASRCCWPGLRASGCG